MKKALFFVGMYLFVLCSASFAADIPKLINYQGMLTDDSGNPLTDTVNITFKIYNDSLSVSPGDKKWEETHSDVPVIHGLFNVMLGGVSSLDLDFSEDYWLDITVGGEHQPDRLRFVSVGYAYRARWAERSDTADYALSSPSGPGDHTWTFRVTDGGDTAITTGGCWGIARFGNTLYGNADSTHVNLGVASFTGTSGKNEKYCTVGGGKGNTADTTCATVGGGFHNIASGFSASVGGGYSNVASGNWATVAGGWSNSVTGYCTSVAGGRNNTADTSYAAVGGGYDNIASGHCSSLGGGLSNVASGDWATVGGGHWNTAGGYCANVTGGYDNTAYGRYATVAGGYYNSAYGRYATVAGGYYNTASGNYSFASGFRAKANHPGTFVWADSSVDADFASTDTNQFLIRASGGVGIGTTNPLRDLHIAGPGFTEIQLEKTNEPTSKWHISVYEQGLYLTETDVAQRMTLENGGNVGIGTTNPNYKLDVNGDINVSGSYNVKKGGDDYTHPDYVFEPDYQLMPLDELKRYVFENKTLPNVISAEDVKKNNGFKMDELLIQMLEKIEEQTLYILQLEERIDRLENEQESRE